jgi:RES domain-containing protein
LFRHFVDAGVDPAEVRRRIGKVRVEGLTVLDLTSERVADAVGLDQEDLTGDDYGACQAVGVAALQAGFGGILAPSAALPGRRTLAVFPSGMACVVPVWSRVRQAPPRLAALRSVIPPLGQRP